MNKQNKHQSLNFFMFVTNDKETFKLSQKFQDVGTTQ